MSRRIAVLGAGRSGLAIARAGREAGDAVTVFDQKPLADLATQAEHLEAVGAHLTVGFPSHWNANEWDEVITSPGIRRDHPVLQSAQSVGLPILGEIDFAARVSKAPIIGITGTNGKSTTTVMTVLALKAVGVDAVLCGNIYGSGYDEMPLTEAALNSAPNQVLVAEVSSFQLEWTSLFRPISATITSLSDDHLDRYASFQDYMATKQRIFANMAADSTAIWKSSDPLAKPKNFIGQTKTYNQSGNDLWIESGKLRGLGTEFEISAWPFREPHNLSNAQAALLLAFGAAGNTFDFRMAAQGLSAFKGLRHRMERLGSRNGVEVINNSMCTNPEAVVASSGALKQPQHLIVGGKDKDMDFSPLKNYLQSAAVSVYLYGSDAPKIARQLEADWPVFATMADAFDAAAKAATEGEVIMLAPGAASTDQFSDFRDRGEQFRAMAKEWLES